MVFFGYVKTFAFGFKGHWHVLKQGECRSTPSRVAQSTGLG